MTLAYRGPRYTCIGPKRGPCGISHASLTSADQCIREDNRLLRIDYGPHARTDRQVYGEGKK